MPYDRYTFFQFLWKFEQMQRLLHLQSLAKHPHLENVFILQSYIKTKHNLPCTTSVQTEDHHPNILQSVFSLCIQLSMKPGILLFLHIHLLKEKIKTKDILNTEIQAGREAALNFQLQDLNRQVLTSFSSSSF